MRATPKLVCAVLATLLLTLFGALATDAFARSAARTHHPGRHAARHSNHLRARRTKGPRAGSHPRAAAPTGPKPRVVKTHEHPAAPGAPAKPAKPAKPGTPGKSDAAASAAATIATVLATQCQNTEITPQPGNVALAREAVLCLVNRERAEHSLAPLTTSRELEAAAEDHNAEMIQDDYFAHVAPDGETPVERIKKTGYIASESVGYVIGENLAWGTYALSTPKAIVEAWIASPGHLANILESRYTETGIGVTPAVPHSLAEGSPGATYAQEFGVIVH